MVTVELGDGLAAASVVGEADLYTAPELKGALNGLVDDGCEASLDGDSNCGTCKNQCASGTICKGGGCSCSAGSCAAGTECCDGACVDTGGTCYPWPCIPGTAREKNNCGGCGMACALFCCR